MTVTYPSRVKLDNSELHDDPHINGSSFDPAMIQLSPLLLGKFIIVHSHIHLYNNVNLVVFFDIGS